VQGYKLDERVLQFIDTIEVERSDSIVDQCKLTLTDPNSIISSSKVFAPGNEIDIFMGWKRVGYMGRFVLMPAKVSFPLDGNQTFDFTGYSRDYFLGESRPETGNAIPQRKGQKRDYPTMWEDAAIEEILESIANRWGLVLDVDPVKIQPGNVIQGSKTTDLEFLHILGNLTGMVFWIDYDPVLEKSWILHFKNSDRIFQEQIPLRKYQYNAGNQSTLLNFEPDVLFQSHWTQLRVQAAIRHPLLGVIGNEDVLVAIDSKTAEGWELSYEDELLEQIPDDVEDPSAEAIKILIGDYSFRVIPYQEIKSRADLEVWALAWFARNRNEFIIGNGTVIGDNELDCRQVHVLRGLGPMYDGRYYFSRVRHVMQKDRTYQCEFTARKVLPGL
jgi:phage protein D